jgi:hypothetical protein
MSGLTRALAQWPDDANLRQFAHSLATVGTTAERLRLNAGEIYAYLSRTAFGAEQLADVIPDEPMFTRLPVIVAQRAAVESAIEIASALDATVLPAAVMRPYLPKPAAEPGMRTPHDAR